MQTFILNLNKPIISRKEIPKICIVQQWSTVLISDAWNSQQFFACTIGVCLPSGKIYHGRYSMKSLNYCKGRPLSFGGQKREIAQCHSTTRIKLVKIEYKGKFAVFIKD